VKRTAGPRIVLATILLVLSGCVVHDTVVPVSRQYSTRMMIRAIEQYRQHVSPRIGGVVRCRFQPSCSVYGLASVRKHGALRGGARAAWRIARCGPWTASGTIDPP
jgi:putative membrane protein insertion efficiency factor